MRDDRQRRQSPGRPLRAVVIGSGFGGLAAAVRLQAAGVATTLIEQRGQLGGRAGRIRDSGYTFDTGPSLITAPALLDGVFRAAGRRLDDYVSLVALDPFYRVWFHDGTHLDYTSDLDRMKAAMARFDPSDAERLEAFFAKLRPIYEAVITEGLGARPFDSLGRMAAFAPRVVRLSAWEPVARYVGRHFRDWRHRFMYSFHPLFLGGSPFRAPSIFLMIPYLEKEGGVWYARGGMHSLVEGLAALFRDIGGKVRVDTPARGIEVAEGSGRRARVAGVRVASTNGRGGDGVEAFLPADIVVSNADVGHTYGTLLGAVRRRRWTDRRLRKVAQSMSCFLLYLGVRRKYPRLSHHTIILGRRYRGLVRDIFDRKVLASDFSMYLHVPSRSEPSMAPPGCESIYVLVPVPNAASGIDWEREAGPMTDRVIAALEAWGLEGLRAAIEVQHVFTPDDFAIQYNATLGNAFGIEPRLTQTAWFRPHNRSEEVDGLYLVGAGTHPGAGVPGVVLSAAATMHAVAEDFAL
ncbi:MAG: phytoene desaturase [Gemmatimonadetes bacterium]|nr:phytoene desaturase [Gemmatimonadota bacterium]MYC89997.1 phytoene desaturase [Gemmatimonadota bacterium]MYG34679.1 phytoene desaturase [Gemmatimonadota bacterium]